LEPTSSIERRADNQQHPAQTFILAQGRILHIGLLGFGKKFQLDKHHSNAPAVSPIAKPPGPNTEVYKRGDSACLKQFQMNHQILRVSSLQLCDRPTFVALEPCTCPSSRIYLSRHLQSPNASSPTQSPNRFRPPKTRPKRPSSVCSSSSTASTRQARPRTTKILRLPPETLIRPTACAAPWRSRLRDVAMWW
jgi:hypothetical protein